MVTDISSWRYSVLGLWGSSFDGATDKQSGGVRALDGFESREACEKSSTERVSFQAQALKNAVESTWNSTTHSFEDGPPCEDSVGVCMSARHH